MTTTEAQTLPGLYPASEALKCGGDYRYFVVEGEVGIRAAEAASEQWQHVRQQREAFVEKYGGVGVYTSGSAVTGLAVLRDKEPNQGVGGVVWRRNSKEVIGSDKLDYWTAQRGRSKAQQAGYANVNHEMRDIREVVVGVVISSTLDMETSWLSDAPGGRCYMHSTHAFDFGGVIVLAYKRPPKDMKVSPEVREIEAVEFMEMAVKAAKGTPMPDPTLADFQRAFEPIWSANADAPRLPEGYEFNGTQNERLIRRGIGCSDWIPDEAALALCVVTAMEIGAWWERNRGYVAHIYTNPGRGWQVHILGSEPHNSTHPSLPSACLAALVAMGEGGGE